MTTLEEKLLALPPSTRQRLLQFSYAPDAVRVLTDEPEVCGKCGQTRHLFVARGGSSCCWRCDLERQGLSKANRVLLGLDPDLRTSIHKLRRFRWNRLSRSRLTT
jgi:hypothetical protein